MCVELFSTDIGNSWINTRSAELWVFIEVFSTQKVKHDKLDQLCFISGAMVYWFDLPYNFGGIPSTPGDLLSFIALIFLATNSGVTTNGPKYSDLAPWNLASATGNEHDK